MFALLDLLAAHLLERQWSCSPGLATHLLVCQRELQALVATGCVRFVAWIRVLVQLGEISAEQFGTGPYLKKFVALLGP